MLSIVMPANNEGDIIEKTVREGHAEVISERNRGVDKALRYWLDRAAQETVFQTDSDRRHYAADFWKPTVFHANSA